jgi:hypothetical protein
MSQYNNKHLKTDRYSYIVTNTKSRRLNEHELVDIDPYMKFEEFKIPKNLGYGKNYYAPQTAVTTQKSWNATAERTYDELDNYFRPTDFYNSKGYYSNYYKEDYFDGYGYNFYYGNTGYYEYSRPPQAL